MSNLSSQQTEALDCELLSNDELQAVSGGVAFAIGRAALGVPFPGGSAANLGSLRGIRPFNCITCVQGVPRDLVSNPALNQVVRAGF
jgi:bacteriocin-like protein